MRTISLIFLVSISLNTFGSESLRGPKTRAILKTIFDQLTPLSSPHVPKSSSGENYVKSMMKKNRIKIKELHKKLKQEEQNSVSQKNDSFISKMKDKENSTLLSHKNQISKTYEKWEKKKIEFYKNLPQYKKSLIHFEMPKKKEKEILKKALLSPIFKSTQKTSLIPGSLELSIKSQGKRPTCAAFAGVRAIELLLKKKGKVLDLSEQYFYWSSKPKCQNSPCSQRGSWVLKGFAVSKNSSGPNIPIETNCPYKKTPKEGNETQIPLKKGCSKGFVKIQDFEKLKYLDDVISHLESGYPVIAAFKLSPNFYKNQGVVSLSDDPISYPPDEHAKGHALVLVGYIELPRHLSRKEGKVCFLAANSWTEGWGVGGHACLTESWVRKYKIANAFVSLKTIKEQ